MHHYRNANRHVWVIKQPQLSNQTRTLSVQFVESFSLLVSRSRRSAHWQKNAMMALILFPVKAALGEKKPPSRQYKASHEGCVCRGGLWALPCVRLTQWDYLNSQLMLTDGNLSWKPRLLLKSLVATLEKMQLNLWGMDTIMLTWTDGDDLELFGSSLQHLDILTRSNSRNNWTDWGGIGPWRSVESTCCCSAEAGRSDNMMTCSRR